MTSQCAGTAFGTLRRQGLDIANTPNESEFSLFCSAKTGGGMQPIDGVSGGFGALLAPVVLIERNEKEIAHPRDESLSRSASDAIRSAFSGAHYRLVVNIGLSMTPPTPTIAIVNQPPPERR